MSEGEKGNSISFGAVRLGVVSKADEDDQSDDLWGSLVVEEDQVIRFLHLNAAAVLRVPGLRYELRRAIAWNYGRSKGLAWYHHPSMATDEHWKNGEHEPTMKDGYVLLGQFTTPEG